MGRIFLGIAKWFLGSLVTKDHMREVVDLVFAEAHKAVALTPTGIDDAALSKLEGAIDKEALADDLAKLLDTVL